MGLFRIEKIPTGVEVEKIFNTDLFDTNDEGEWNEESAKRLKEPAWEQRYEYESEILKSIINTSLNNGFEIKSVLELGSGPGNLSQKILKNYPNLEYHLVDKPLAKTYFEDNNFKGKFFVKDLSMDFNTDGLLPKYDLVITNDFLEHVLNPSIIVQKIYDLTHKDSTYFISNPNWRMGHQFIYRGLFDYDNLIYFLYVHKFRPYGMVGSPLRTPTYPRISSESLLSDEDLTSWNHYIAFKHREL
jgi:2-polyprenyl-3-methyl-5-hydroxy-6-metoxy-1,4-benzoquinol methylase